jgi:hypothetical protein
MEKNNKMGRAKIWNLSLRVKPRRTERDAKLMRRYLKDKTEGTFSKPTTERCKAMFEIKRMTQGPDPSNFRIRKKDARIAKIARKRFIGSFGTSGT